MKQHPLSAAFPAMPTDEFEALKDSITDIGVQNPITLFEGMVIDGWHRYTAAQEVGVHCPTIELIGVDPQAFVIAQNKARRHIQQGQIALAVAAVYQWKPAGRPGNSAPGAGFSTAKLADIAGVGTRTMEQAKAVESKATPKVKEAVKSGEISVKRGAEIAKLPAKEQTKAIKEPPKTAPATNDAREDEFAESAFVISELAEENETLRAQIAVGQMDAPEVERISAAELIADLRAQVKTLEAELAAMRISRDRFQSENRELMKQVGMNARELKKLRAA
jgi:ribosomal protein L29